MTLGHFLLVLLAGTAAGTINTVVGSGSLITFPTLVGLGYAPLVANVSNNIGLVPGSLSGVYGYRRELAGQRLRLTKLVPASLLGEPLVIGGIAGDQQAAMFGQACHAPGMAKNTYGTGCFMLLHTGGEVVNSSHGLVSTPCAHLKDKIGRAHA